MKKGIIFDLDGTLWDTTDAVAESWKEVIEEHRKGLRTITPEDMKGVMGHTMDEIAAMLFPMLELKEGIELMHLCCDRENEYLRVHGGKLYPNLIQTIQELSKNYLLFIVSNCQQGYIEAFLECYGIQNYFKDIECFGNNQLPKSENISLVVKRNNLEKAVYVGDILADYHASTKAGVPFIHAAYGFGIIDEDVASIQDLGELKKLLSK